MDKIGGDGLEALYPLPNPSKESPRAPTDTEAQAIKLCARLQFFLATAPTRWTEMDAMPCQELTRFHLPNGEDVSCVLWNGLFHISGTDVVRALAFRFEAFGRTIQSVKKWEEGVFSDLRNLKHGVDAILEEPKSPLLEYLFRHGCIRTQKKVYFWFSVPHDRLFLDALERDLKREKQGQEPTSVITGEPARSFRYDPRRSLYDQFAGRNASLPLSASINETERVTSCQDRTSKSSKWSNVPDCAHYPSNQATDGDSAAPVRADGPQHHHPHINEADLSVRTRSPKDCASPSVDHTTHQIPVVDAGTYDKSTACSRTLQHVGDETRARAFSCPLQFCQRPFRRLEHLKRHVRTHTRERPYICEQCGRSFSRQDNLLQHIRSHSRIGHSDTTKRNRTRSGSAFLSDAVLLPRSASERLSPRSNMGSGSRQDLAEEKAITHGPSHLFVGEISRLQRLSTAPPGWA